MPSETDFQIIKNLPHFLFEKFQIKSWSLILSNFNLFTHFGTPMNVVTHFFTALARSLTSITVPWKLTFICTNKSMVSTRAPIFRGWPENKHIREMLMLEHVMQALNYLLSSMLFYMDMRNYLFLKLSWHINWRCVSIFKKLCIFW